jgi:hypothetical protein
MDAKGVEIQIREKLGVIGNSIASFVNAEEKEIYEKLSRLNFYVYDEGADVYIRRDRANNGTFESNEAFLSLYEGYINL